ncbi:MAG TPA: hypothetical protein VGI10_31260 [Polyangiaceae bacterium]
MFSVSLSAGCAGNHDALEKRITSLQNDVSRLQNHGDRLEERLEALELRKDTPPAAASASDKIVDHPPLKVVKLEPQTSDSALPSSAPVAELAAGEAVDDKAPRPMIRIHGSRVDGDADSAGGAPRRRGE